MYIHNHHLASLFQFEKMSVPVLTSDVTKDWLKNVLAANNNKDVEVKQLNLLDSKAGLFSNVFRATIINGKGEEQKLFIKMMPDPEDPYNVYLNDYGLDVTEIKTYKEILPMLDQFEAQHGKKSGRIAVLSPHFYAGDVDLSKDSRGYYIIMEDIYPQYSMAKISQCLTMAQICSALKKMAHFHAVAYAYSVVNKVDYTVLYPSNYKKYMQDKGILDLLDSIYVRAEQDMNEIGRHDLAKCMKHMSLDYVNTFKKVNQDQAHFLIHGDVWANNVMFESKRGGNNDCKLIDWQFCSSGHPLLDFACMAYISTKPKETEDNLKIMYDVYHDAFANVLEDLNVQPPWTRLEFEELANSQAYLHLVCGLMVGYDPVVKLPNMFERFVWLVEKAIQYCPQYFS